MSTNLDRFREDLNKAIQLGLEMSIDLTYREMQRRQVLKKEDEDKAKQIERSFERNYQKWYTESQAVIKQLLPDRLEEFCLLYRPDSKRKQIDAMTYRIQDWLNGARSGQTAYGENFFDDFASVSMQFYTQMEILKTVESRFESSLHDIAQVVQADLFDSELDSSRELAKKGFLRGAGAIAGVVLEKHLAQVCKNHDILIRKRHPTINDFNELLKHGSVIDVPSWLQIQRLGALRNICDHNKLKEPTKPEVLELIEGVEKLCKTLY